MLNLLTLKNNFNDIKNLRESSLNLMKSLGDKIDTLSVIYSELIKNNTDESETGLDSLHFQMKLIKTELENNQGTFKIIDNRIYGDYYKLFKNLIKFLCENIKNKNLISQFENKDYKVYKDLNSVQNYEFTNTTEIYNDIVQIIDLLQTELTEREHKLAMQKIKRDSGLNIHTLTSKVSYNNNYLKNHITLFTENIETFNSFHKKYLIRFLLKTKLFYGQINNDIKLEESKNSLDYKLEESESIILEEDEEVEIRNLIQKTEDISGKNMQTDTRNNMVNELNSMILGVSDSASTCSPVKCSKSNSSNGYSTPISTEYNSDNDRTTAAIYIQTRIRGKKARKDVENKKEDKAALFIQNKYRIKNENLQKINKQIDEIIEEEKCTRELEEIESNKYKNLLESIEAEDNYLLTPRADFYVNYCVLL